MKTRFLDGAMRALRGVVLLSGFLASAASWAVLPDAGIWDDANSCASTCHSLNYMPLNSTGPTEGLKNALAGSASSFGTYVNTRRNSGESGYSYMSAVTSAEGSVLHAYLLQLLYGDIEGSGLVTSSAPSYSKNFGSALVGVEATSVVLTITNWRPNQAVTYSLAGVGTDTTAEYWISNENCSTRQIPAAGGACNLTLHFRPAVAGSRPATLAIAVGAPPIGASASTPSINLTHTISLSGTGLAPGYSVAATSLSTSTVVNTSVGVSTAVTNNGTAPLVLSNVSLGGTYAAEYTFDTSNTNVTHCVTLPSLNPGLSCTVAVTFTPQGTDLRSAAVSITHNASGSPASIALNGRGTAAPAPAILLSASEVRFSGTTDVGTSRSMTFNATNTGAAPLTFSSLAMSGGNASEFSRGGSCSTTGSLAINASCTLTITFAPSGTGTRSASLAIVSNAGDFPSLTLPLTGTGALVPVPQASLSASTIAFGNQTVGGTYAPRQITLSNPGTGPLSLSTPSIPAGAFSLDGTSTCGSSLAANATCHIVVRFQPTQAATDYSATLSFTSNAAGSPHSVALTGRGTAAAAPVLAWTPAASTVAFGTVALGSTSPVQTVTLTNQGPGAATISLVNIVGADAAQFTVALRNCTAGGLLYEGGSCDLDLSFVPGLPGTRSAQVQFASTGSPPGTLTLTGVGSGGATPTGSLSETAVAFGSVKLGARSAPAELTLSSNGSAPLQVSGLSASGPFTVASRTCPALPFDLPPGNHCVLTVSYAPSGAGVQTGTLSVAGNAANGPLQVPLSGEGQAPAEEANSGCSIARGDSPFDPVLWLLVVLAVAVLWQRRVQARRGRAS